MRKTPVIEVHRAEHIDAKHAHALHRDYGIAAAGILRGEVGRTDDDVAAIVKEITHVGRAVGVVAQRDDVRTRIEQVLRVGSADALDLGGVFAVDDAKIHAQSLFLCVQRSLQVGKSRVPHNVTDC